VKFLIDTHYLIWAAVNPEEMEAWALELMEDPNNEVCVSAASLFEISTKMRNGKLPGVEKFEKDMIAKTELMGITILPLEAKEMCKAARFKEKHKDPFDRMIAATGIHRKLQILSTDPSLDLFGAQRLSPTSVGR
jgi:PIN domain nuclease of toxin-antitoxin system